MSSSLEPQLKKSRVDKNDEERINTVDILDLRTRVNELLAKRIGKEWPIRTHTTIHSLMEQYVQNYEDFFIYRKSKDSTTMDKCHLFVDKEDLGAIDNLNIKRLIELSTPSKFGKGDQDCFDESVRKAREIKGDRIKFSQSWIIENLILNLDQKYERHLKSSLHKLCIYEEGGFFAKHVDTIHSETHYGSCVVCLPTEHEGGELIVRFDSKEKVFNFSENKKCCQAVSFYTDCEHEVKPVTKGTRIVLQYDLHFGKSKPEIDLRNQSYRHMEGIENPTQSNTFSHQSANIKVINQLIDSICHDNTLQGTIGLFLCHRYAFKGIDETKLKGIDKDLWNDLSPHFKLYVCPVIVDGNEVYPNGEEEREESYSYSAHLFDHDLMFGLKSEHPLLNEDVTIFTSDSSRSVKEILKSQEIGYTGNESQAFELSYVSAIMTITRKRN